MLGSCSITITVQQISLPMAFNILSPVNYIYNSETSLLSESDTSCQLFLSQNMYQYHMAGNLNLMMSGGEYHVTTGWG